MNHNSFTHIFTKGLYLFSIVALAMVLTLGVAPVQVAFAATFAVDSTADAVDANPGDGVCATAGGVCALRAAIQEANALLGDDTILLPSGTYTLTLSGADDNASAGDLDLTSNVVISATGTTKPIIDGNGSVLNERVFHVTGAFMVTIAGVVLQNGNGLSDYGGGIFVASGGTLTLNTSLLTGNRSRCGNAIYSEGDLILNGSSLIENDFADTPYCSTMTIVSYPGNMTLNDTLVGNNASGGGIYNGGTLTLNNSSVSGNTGHLVGGIDNYGTVTLNNSAVSNNSVTVSGGGIYNYGTVILNNSSVSGNSAPQSGGGIFNTGLGTLNVNNSTITGNSASTGGGIYNDAGTATIQNTILAGNTTSGTGPDCIGPIGSSGFNIVGNTSECTFTPTSGDLTNLDPLLGPLQDNGGPTFTHALLPSSPAIDSGNPAPPGSGGNACEATDQRGVARPQGARCDIGAFELEAVSQVIQVTLDIQPGRTPNRIQIEPGDDGSIPVAVLSTPNFDAPQQVDKNSLTFGHTGDETSLHRRGRKGTPDCRTRDVNQDGLPDLVCRFVTGKTGFQVGDTVGILKGKTMDGTPLEGRDAVQIVLDDD